MRYLVYSQIWMALSGLILIKAVAFVNRARLSNDAEIIIFCGLMWVYLLDATAKNSPEDIINQSERLKFFKKHARILGVIRLFCLAVAIYLAFQLRLPKESWYFFAAAALCSWLYSVGFKGRRLKSISLNKTWLIAFAWTAGVFGAIWAFDHIEFYVVSKGLALVLLSLLFLDTSLLDWRDKKGDLAHGIRSIFSEKGLPWKVHIGIALMLLILGFAELIYSEDLLSLKLAGALFGAFLLAAYLAFKSEKNSVFGFWISSWRLAGVASFLL